VFSLTLHKVAVTMTEENPNEQNSLETLLGKIQDLLQFAQQNASKPVDPHNIPSDIEEQLIRMEKEMENFKAISEKIVELSGTPSEDVDKVLSSGDISQVSPAAQRLLRKAEELAFQAKGLGGEVPEGILSDPRSNRKKKAITGQERRKKFKRFGSNDNWKPL
jgi:hypothetical protein